VTGGKEIERPVDLATLPLYVRAGGIVPIGPVKQYVSEKVDKLLNIRIYPGADGRFVLYEDDGSSFTFERGDFMRLEMQWNDKSRSLRCALAQGSRMFGPPEREMIVEIPGGPQKSMHFNGSPVTVHL
jgi:alpha-glucosidase (family GH31 glycosyl hydrolase)